MKKEIRLSLVAMSLLISSVNIAQVSIPTNTAPAGTQYVGWNGLGVFTKPLDMNNGFNNQPIRFFTNNSGTNGNVNSTQRMTITPTGLVGVGLIAPTSLFHLQSNLASGGNLFRTDGLGTQLNQWQLYTGGLEKFSLYIPGGSNSVFLNSKNVAGSMRLQTGDTTRLFIRESNAANPGFVGIGKNYTSPLSLLHINGTVNNTGFLFGTSGLTSLDNSWRMFTGSAPGNGELTVFANDLSSGIYTYSLVADGKVVASKKMMKN